MDKDTTIQQLKDFLRKFRDERDWEKFHNPKDLALAISVEVGEFLEKFLFFPTQPALIYPGPLKGR